MSWKKEKANYDLALKHIGDYMLSHSVNKDHLSIREDMSLIKSFIIEYHNMETHLYHAAMLLEEGYYMINEKEKNKYDKDQWFACLKGDEIPERKEGITGCQQKIQ